MRRQPNINLSKENLAKVSEMIETRQKGPKSHAKMLRENRPDEATPIYDSILLNNSENRRSIHQQITAS